MRATQGALIISSTIQIILGFSQLWGICWRYIYFSEFLFISLTSYYICCQLFAEIGIPMIILFVALSQVSHLSLSIFIHRNMHRNT